MDDFYRDNIYVLRRVLHQFIVIFTIFENIKYSVELDGNSFQSIYDQFIKNKDKFKKINEKYKKKILGLFSVNPNIGAKKQYISYRDSYLATFFEILYQIVHDENDAIKLVTRLLYDNYVSFALVDDLSDEKAEWIRMNEQLKEMKHLELFMRTGKEEKLDHGFGGGDDFDLAEQQRYFNDLMGYGEEEKDKQDETQEKQITLSQDYDFDYDGSNDDFDGGEGVGEKTMDNDE